MFQYPLLFFALAIVSAIIGFGEIAPRIELYAKTCFFIFLVFTLLAFIKEQKK